MRKTRYHPGDTALEAGTYAIRTTFGVRTIAVEFKAGQVLPFIGIEGYYYTLEKVWSPVLRLK